MVTYDGFTCEHNVMFKLVESLCCTPESNVTLCVDDTKIFLKNHFKKSYRFYKKKKKKDWRGKSWVVLETRPYTPIYQSWVAGLFWGRDKALGEVTFWLRAISGENSMGAVNCPIFLEARGMNALSLNRDLGDTPQDLLKYIYVICIIYITCEWDILKRTNSQYVGKNNATAKMSMS